MSRSRTFVAALNRNDLDLVVYPTVCSGVLTHSAAVAGSNSNGYFISPSGGVPGVTVPMGTDKNGMDMLTRLMYGGRVSLIIGFIVVIAIGIANMRKDKV